MVIITVTLTVSLKSADSYYDNVSHRTIGQGGKRYRIVVSKKLYKTSDIV